MTISSPFARRAAGVAALLFGLAVAGMAQAVPVYTYTFSQSDYRPADPSISTPGTVTGSFSGTLDSTGHISRNTLTAYHFEIGGFDSSALSLFAWSHDTLPFYFSYIPGDASSFAVVDHGRDFGAYAIDVCIGLPTGITCNAGSARGAGVMALGGTGSPVDNFWLVAVTTDSTPLLTGSVADVGDPVYLVATTPIPGSVLLFGSALAGLGGMIWRQRKFGLRAQHG